VRLQVIGPGLDLVLERFCCFPTCDDVHDVRFFYCGYVPPATVGYFL
jgi:hypothetical protein